MQFATGLGTACSLELSEAEKAELYAILQNAGTKSNMKTGELVHAESAVPASQKLEVFGPVDSSSFRGLGLAEALSDHLEGRVPDLLKDQGIIHPTKSPGVITFWACT